MRTHVSNGLASLGRRVDYWPRRLAVGIGSFLGVAVVVPIAIGPTSLPAFLSGLVFIGGALWLAQTARPIVVFPEHDALAPVVSAPRVLQKSTVDPPEMLVILGGTYQMGSHPEDKGHRANEEPKHEVAISPFLLAATPTTQSLYKQVAGKSAAYPIGDDLPVNNVTFIEALLFCNKLSRWLGLEQCYVIDGEHIAWKRDAKGFRLPTEAEWEYAARASTTTAYFFGNDKKGLEEYAWLRGSTNRIEPVRLKRPNQWGLFDIYGNVLEWCWDGYAPYPSKRQINPIGPSKFSERVARGGSFFQLPEELRSATRARAAPNTRLAILGFRLARNV